MADATLVGIIVTNIVGIIFTYLGLRFFWNVKSNTVIASVICMEIGAWGFVANFFYGIDAWNLFLTVIFFIGLIVFLIEPNMKIKIKTA